MQRIHTMYLLLLFALCSVLAACGGSGSGGSDGEDNEETVSALDCDAITLSRSSANAGETVVILTDQTINQFSFSELTTGSEVVDVAVVANPVDGGYSFSVPFTANLVSGSDYQLTVNNDEANPACALPSLSADALTMQDKALAAQTLDDLEAFFEDFEAFFGYDPDDISEEDLQDPLLFSTALTHAYFSDPESEVSIPYLRSLLQSATDEEKLLIAQVLHELDIQTLIAETQQLYADAAFTVERNRTSSKVFTSRNRVLATNSCTNIFNDPSRYRVNIRDARALSVALKLSDEARKQIANGAARQERNAVKGHLINTVSTGAAIVGGPTGVFVGFILGIKGAADFMNEHSTNQVANLLPSKISDAELKVLPRLTIEEDYTDVFSEPLWDFRVDAHSEGLNLSKQVLDAAFQAAGLIPGIPTQAGISLTGISTVSGKVYNQAKIPQDCGLSIPPFTWSSINSNIETLVDVDITGDAFTETTFRKLTPQELGSSKLEVSLKPEFFATQGTTLADISDDVTVANVRKEYSTPSSTIYIDTAGQQVNIEFLVFNSVLPESYSLSHSPASSITSQSVQGDVISVSVNTPSDENSYPQTVTITSTSSNLGPDDSPRSKTVTIDVSPLTVTITKDSETECLEDGYMAAFSAEVRGAQNDSSVTWSTSSGTLTSNGQTASLTATVAGFITVTATSVEDPQISDSFQVNVESCESTMYLTSYRTISLSSPAVDLACDASSNPSVLDADESIGRGEQPFMVEPDRIAQDHERLGEDRIFNLDIELNETTISTAQDVDSNCVSKSVIQSSAITGKVEATTSNSLYIDRTHTTAGECFELPSGVVNAPDELYCHSGNSGLTDHIFWLHEHSDAATYQLTNTLECTLPPAVPAQVMPNYTNMNYFIKVFDSAGIEISPRIDVPEFWNPITTTQCYEGARPMSSMTWNIPSLPEGGTVIVYVSLIEALGSAESQINPRVQMLNATGTTNGTLSVNVIK